MFKTAALAPLLCLSLAGLLAACDDKGAILYGPDQPLAVGAYYHLEFGDACPGGGMIPNPCNSEVVTDVMQASSDNPAVADLVLQMDHPRADVAQYAYYVVGKKPGKASFYFKGIFSDGTIREAGRTVWVEAPDSFKVTDLCADPPDATNLLVTVGDKGGFQLALFAGKDSLVGWLPGAVTADGLTQDFRDDDLNPYDWQAPAAPIVEPLQSAVVTKIDGTLTAFGPDQVTGIDLAPANSPPAAYTQPGDFYVSTLVRVDGEASSCAQLTTELRSATPSICSGPSGEAVWLEDVPGQGHAAVHAEGSCVISTGMAGGPTLATQTSPIFFVQPPPPGDAEHPGQFDPCSVEGETACPGPYMVVVCQKGAWVMQPYCPASQVCDYVPDTTPGCVAGAPCARCRGLQ